MFSMFCFTVLTPLPPSNHCNSLLGGNQCVKCEAGDSGCEKSESACNKKCKAPPTPTTTTVKPGKDLYKCVGGSKRNGGGMCGKC